MLSVTIVTWNSEKYLQECFAALAAQDYPDLEVIIVDNASEDGTRELLARVDPGWQVIYNDKNVGFAAGQNQAIRAARGDWVLCLNPDVVLSPDFITRLIAAGEAHPEAGSLCGKLLRWDPSAGSLPNGSERQIPRGPKPARDDKKKSFERGPEETVSQPGMKFHGGANSANRVTNSRAAAELQLAQGVSPGSSRKNSEPRSGDTSRDRVSEDPLYLSYVNPEAEVDPRKTRILDSTGIYFTPNMRHLDRGAEEIDCGQYDRLQYVFGASGAAAFFRRKFIDDVSVEGEFFDEEFFAFREDGDLAWRAQLMGWKCLYVPTAVAWHVRRVTPERRKDLPLVINWHSAKNRFLMRGKNSSLWLCRRLFWPVLWRDILTFGYAIVRDRRLWSAVTYWWRARDSICRKRAIIQSRRRVSDRDLLWWFSNRPRAIDVVESKRSAVSTQNSAENGATRAE